MDYVVDTSDDKRLQLIRYIAGETKEIDGTPVYIFPIVLRREYKIALETIQAVLADLEERDYIEYLQRPNHKLTDKQRLRREDEEDYYCISVNLSFYDYYKALELTAPFHKADTVISKPRHSFTPTDTSPQNIQIKTDSSNQKARVEPRSYDHANGILTIAGRQVRIIKQPNKKGTRQESRQARLMRYVFDDVNSNFGITPMRKVVSVRGYDFKPKHRKLVKSYVSEVNEKVSQETGINELLITNQLAVMINEIYLK